jgi:hypothetical protein
MRRPTLVRIAMASPLVLLGLLSLVDALSYLRTDFRLAADRKLNFTVSPILYIWAVVSVAIGAVGVVLAVKVDLKRQSNCCRMCGYNLCGNESGTCPECGTVIKR